MKMQVDKTALRAGIQTFAAANPGIAAVYLFGSAATGKMTPASDLDIALMCTGHMDGFEKISMETASRSQYLDTRFLYKRLAG